MHTRWSTAAVVLPVCAAVGLALAPQASAASPAAVWEMNEPAGATVMADSSGHGITGTIGSEVKRATFGGRKGYSFPYLAPSAGVHPQHLVTVRDDARLDPGTATFAVSVTLRYGGGANFRNVLQKGQASSPGGYYKVEVNRGKVVCLFRGSNASGGVSSALLSDNQVHTVTCTRSPRAVTMTVDGRTVSTRNVNTGSISNSAAMSIGGKTSCNQTTVECDYYAGWIDRIAITTG